MDYTNTFILFLTPKKITKGSDSFEVYSGKLNVDGKELEFSGYKRVGKNGGEFISGKIKPPYKKPEPGGTLGERDSSFDIPF